MAGNFSFVKNKTMRFALEYDYSNMLHDTYPFHNKESYSASMKIMNYIQNNSWETFVKNKQFISCVSKLTFQSCSLPSEI
jgi:hypothetical protein